MASNFFERATNNLLKHMKSMKGQKKKPEANAANTLSQLMRGKKLKCSEAARVLTTREAVIVSNQVQEGPMVKCVLISEGLGNRRNMNYYGPEAIQSAPGIFEGKPCFLDHPSESESMDIPERRVREKCGYFKNVKVENMAGELCVTGELHFDLAESGTDGFKKALTALHYQQEFPGLESEYVGLSINADGEWEERSVQVGDEKLDVNYVTRFTNAMSCDIVTSPARGGRFLALVESAAGVVIRQNKEVDSMKKGVSESLKAAQTALKEADLEKDPKKKAEMLSEARKLFESFLKEAAKKAAEDESEDEAMKDDKEESEDEAKDDEKKKEDESEDESEDEADEKCEDDSKDKADDEDEDEDEDESESDAKDDKDMKDDDSDDDDTVESKRIVIKALAKESGVTLSDYRIGKLIQVSLKEAKAEIADLKKSNDVLIRGMIKKFDIPVSNFEKMSESDREEMGSKNNDLFSNLVK